MDAMEMEMWMGRDGYPQFPLEIPHCPLSQDQLKDFYGLERVHPQAFEDGALYKVGGRMTCYLGFKQANALAHTNS